jgi:CysZ protein
MVKDFISGITSYGAALRHISSHGLWVFILLPGILTVLAGAGVLLLGYGLSDNLGGLLVGIWPWEWGRSVVESIARVFGGLLVVVFGLIIFKQFIMVVCAPILSVLSERVEDQLTGRRSGAGFSFRQITSDILRGLRIALRNIFRELSLTIVLLLLGLIPVFTPFTTAAIFIIQAYYAGFGNMDFALERHFRYRDSVRFVQRYRGLAIGNGAVFIVLLLTFVGFLVALPLSTVAVTIETVKRLEA